MRKLKVKIAENFRKKKFNIKKIMNNISEISIKFKKILKITLHLNIMKYLINKLRKLILKFKIKLMRRLT